jgi:hypothetical protein
MVVAVSVSFTDVCEIVSVPTWTPVMLAIKLLGKVSLTSPVHSLESLLTRQDLW